MDTCAVCGLELRVGDFPCIVTARPHASGMYTAIGDEIDFVQENGAHDPVHFTSKLERKRWLKANGLAEMVRNAGPDDKHVPRWAGMDPQTLANATALVSRPGAMASHGEPPVRMRITHVGGEGIG